MKQPRVCLFPDALRNGGIGRVNLNLAEGFLQHGIGVDFFLTYADERISQIPKDARVFLGKGSTKASLSTLVSYLRRERPDVIVTSHTYTTIAALIARTLARASTRVVVTIHTTFSQDNLSGKSDNLYIRFTTLLCRWFYPKTDQMIAVSQAVANDTAKFLNLNAKQIQVIFNPVVTASLYDKSTAKVEHPFFQEKTAPVLLAIGRLTPQKDFSTLLESFAILRGQQDAKLLLLGEGEEREKLESLAQDLQLGTDFSMPGFISNPYPYLKAADVFVSSSAWEGLPTVVIEALALGTPVVATDCPGGTREILDDGQFGQLVPIRQPSILAKAVRDTLSSTPNSAMLERRGNDFSLQSAIKQYLEILDV
jgi:glycosyltransferase involved in cell wall biosynthesis